MNQMIHMIHATKHTQFDFPRLNQNWISLTYVLKIPNNILKIIDRQGFIILPKTFFIR
jgi:hypothetical protein